MRIAQMILEKADTPDIQVVTELDASERNNNGFGSTDIANDTKQEIIKPSIINNLQVQQCAYQPGEHLFLSTDPFENITTRTIQTKKSDDNLLGMDIKQCEHRHLPQLLDCRKGSSSI